ncbi:hypothetical protein Ahy_B09g095053 isoform A [Arachis hypogaea]|uniref:Uncharacterized protein n=1 Tax=Arachis hypogaea TaxID=3818 RepID=A0A444XCT5_ARAHY|nr:hypothetical protein Ahy_B09g095053 isoform A [Arachis hypogaea]
MEQLKEFASAAKKANNQVLLDFTRLTLYSTRVTSIDLWLNSQMEHQSGSSIYTCYVSSHSAVSMEAEKQTSVSEVSLFCVK